MADKVSVLIPTALRPQTGNQAQVELEGASVKEVLGALTSRYPELGKRLYKNGSDATPGSGDAGSAAASGEINRFINIYVNDEDIRFMENLDTPVKAGDEVSIVPAIAGG